MVTILGSLCMKQFNYSADYIYDNPTVGCSPAAAIIYHEGLPSKPFGRCTLPSDQAAGNVAALATSDGALCYALGQQNTGGWSINTNVGYETSTPPAFR